MTRALRPRTPKLSVASPSRLAGWSGLTFVGLLLTSAGMASVPGAADSVITVREFYSDNAGVVTAAQLIGLLAAFLFAVHARALADALPFGLPFGLSGLVHATGTGVAASAALTAAPVLALTAAADRWPDRVVAAWALASDYTDVALFAAVSMFAAAVATASVRPWVAAIASIVALLSAARSVLLASGSPALQVAAPVGFVVLVAVVSIQCLTRRPGDRVPTPD